MSADDSFDRRLMLATQGGLPLVEKPYHALAEQLGVAPEEVMEKLLAWLRDGRIRRIGAVPNHYAIGWTANGMTVWDVDDAQVDLLGMRVGALDFVTHCYRRPRALPHWPYNLFAMVHGTDRAECEDKAQEIARLLGSACVAHDILYSTEILKKTGVRFIP